MTREDGEKSDVLVIFLCVFYCVLFCFVFPKEKQITMMAVLEEYILNCLS